MQFILLWKFDNEIIHNITKPVIQELLVSLLTFVDK